MGEAEPRRATPERPRRQYEWSAAIGWYWGDTKSRLRGDAATPASPWLSQPECLSQFPPRSARVAINAACCRPAGLKLKIQKFQMLPHTKY